MKMKSQISHRLLLTALIYISGLLSLHAQPVQTLRGKVVDEESEYPLAGVKVVVKLPDGSLKGCFSEANGEFRFVEIPVGRVSLNAELMEYKSIQLDNIEVTSAKEVILNVRMAATSATLDTVTISARRNGEPLNEMATVGAREFSVVETGLYAGSRGEPARMASNYAGVQGADDSRNDVVIRGNSPGGVLWRLDGVNIPNPNHFSIPGTGGGPVTILNNKFLSNSDFFTGAFPAEYANGTAGVFDLRMRNGNNENHEFSGQIGFLGTELMAEGPLSKKSGASYLATFRYSTLGLFSFMGINVGTDAVPRYADASFRFNLPLKNGARLTWWAIGGTSDIDIILSAAERPDTATLIYGQNDRDQYFGSNMGVTALAYSHPLNENTLFKATVAASHQGVHSHHEQIFRRVNSDGLYEVDSLPAIQGYDFRENKYSAYFNWTKKLGVKHTLKFGINADWIVMDYLDSVRTAISDSVGNPIGMTPNWVVRWDSRRGAALIQPYFNYKFRVQEKLTLTAGLTSLLWTLNRNSFSPFEPRIGLSYDLGKGKRISAGAGLHSQLQSQYLYFYGYTTVGRDPQEHNTDLGLTKSWHSALSYDWLLSKNLRFKAEAYYQYLFDIPVDISNSSFSLANTGTGFSRFFPDTLTNAGIGRNLGLELTLERFFARGFYFLLTGSVFDAKYKGSDGVFRNTTFNGRFASNLVLAKEWSIRGKNAFQVGGKITYSGGRWYGPVNDSASAASLEIIYVDSTVNTEQFRPYFRTDIKVLYRWNRPKVTHEFALDLVNVLNTQNILTLTYAPGHPSGNPIREEYQLGFLPLFYYKVDF